MRLFDSHTHIQAPEFNGDRHDTIERARAAGVHDQLVLGWDVPSSKSALALVDAEPGIIAAAGCHPHDAQHMDDESLDLLAELAADPRVAAVGEIGLDFFRNLSPRETQIEVFMRQLETARDVGKPVAIHCREASDALQPIVEEWSVSMGNRLAGGRPIGVMHYFSGDVALGEHYAELGFLISIHTSVTYPKAQRLQDVARQLPLYCLVVETDSPYGPPQSRRGQRNEPAHVEATVAKIAELRNEPAERIADATTENAMRLLSPSFKPQVAGPQTKQTV